MIDLELQELGVRPLPDSEAAIATARSARIAHRIGLRNRAELLVIHVVADFRSHVDHRAQLALVKDGRLRSVIQVRSDALGALGEALIELGRGIDVERAYAARERTWGR